VIEIWCARDNTKTERDNFKDTTTTTTKRGTRFAAMSHRSDEIVQKRNNNSKKIGSGSGHRKSLSSSTHGAPPPTTSDQRFAADHRFSSDQRFATSSRDEATDNAQPYMRNNARTMVYDDDDFSVAPSMDQDVKSVVSLVFDDVYKRGRKVRRRRRINKMEEPRIV
jgi:hypothetical protein